MAIAGGQGQDEQFWALTFKNKNLQEDLLRVYYAWTTGDHWSAPNDARYSFTGWPYLYKIQASCEMPAGTDLKSGDTHAAFPARLSAGARKVPGRTRKKVRR